MEAPFLKEYDLIAARQKKIYSKLLPKANKRDIIKRLPHLADEAYQHVDCLQCARCCKHYSPRFKVPDIVRISKAQRMKQSDFIDQYLQVDEEGDFVVKSQPCPFLHADNTCSIYDIRPSDCERFPYVDEDVLVKRTQITLKNASFCPIVGYVLEKIVDI